MVIRQLPAAIRRSAALSSNCASFSASAKVAGETGGPTPGASPKAGGAPGGSDRESGVGLRHATVAVTRAVEAQPRNCRREFDMFSPNAIVAGGPNGGAAVGWTPRRTALHPAGTACHGRNPLIPVKLISSSKKVMVFNQPLGYLTGRLRACGRSSIETEE